MSPTLREEHHWQAVMSQAAYAVICFQAFSAVRGRCRLTGRRRDSCLAAHLAYRKQAGVNILTQQSFSFDSLAGKKMVGIACACPRGTVIFHR